MRALSCQLTGFEDRRVVESDLRVLGGQRGCNSVRSR